MHTSDPLVSPSKVNFQSVDVIGGTAGYPLIKAHGKLSNIKTFYILSIGKFSRPLIFALIVSSDIFIQAN